MSAELRVIDDPARACAGLLTDTAAAGGALVLTGGSTPRDAYQLAAQKGAAWGSATLWFSDERCVPPDDERSNYLLVKQSLLDALPDDRRPIVHRIEGELGPVDAAQAYECTLRDAGPPELDLVLLGLGRDGHLASLFPGQESLQERARLVVGVEHAGLEPFVPRVSLTLPALASGRRIVFLVTGAEKADAVAAAFGPEARPDTHLPASLLPPLAKNVTVLLDHDAAARL